VAMTIYKPGQGYWTRMLSAGGAGVLILAEWGRLGLGRTALRRHAAPLALLGTLAVAVGGSLPRTLKPLHAGKAPHRHAGHMLRHLSGGGAHVAGPSGWVALFACAPAEQFTRGTGMPVTITAEDVSGRAALHRRLFRPDPSPQYRYVALDEKLRQRAQAAGLLGGGHGRMLIDLASVGTGKEAVHLYAVALPGPTTPADRSPPG